MPHSGATSKKSKEKGVPQDQGYQLFHFHNIPNYEQGIGNDNELL